MTLKLTTMGLKRFVQRSARQLGYDVTYFDRIRLLHHYGVNLVLDVGANIGQYADDMRSFGYQGRMVSFEPLPREFQQLSQHAEGDRLWKTVNLALGDCDGTAEIHVSGNSVSSSLLEILPRHVRAVQTSAYTKNEKIRIARLDSVFGDHYQTGDRVMLKLDTQGYEYKVLQGATESLPSILGIQIEMSLVPLYDGERQFSEMVPYLTGLGFSLMAIEPVFRDSATGQMLAVDGIFYRNEAQSRAMAHFHVADANVI
jgi:FkbM family methyltransferase